MPTSLQVDPPRQVTPSATAETPGETSSPLPSGTRSPSPTPSVTATGIVPEHLFIPRLDVNAPISGKGTVIARNPFTGRSEESFGVPADGYSAVWWSDGPRPGAGMAVVLGHAEIGRYGVFNDLPSLRPGDVVGLTSGTHVLRYRVLDVTAGISKRDSEALRTVLTNPPKNAGLALVTCSGDVNAALSSHNDNTVVFASLESIGTG